MSDDAATAEVIEGCKKARVIVRIRGTDEHPVVEVLDKRTLRVVGGIELKRRLA